MKRGLKCSNFVFVTLFVAKSSVRLIKQSDFLIAFYDVQFLWIREPKNLADKIPFFSKRACPFYNYYTAVFPVTHAIFGIFPQKKQRQGEREANTCRPWNSCCLPCDLLSWNFWEFHCCFCASSQHNSSTQFIVTNLTNISVMRYTGIGEIRTGFVF